MTGPQYSHDPTAVIGRRLGAYVIDLLLIPLILAIIPLVFFFATADLTEYTGGPPCSVLEVEGLSQSDYFCLTEVTTSNTQSAAEHSTVTFKRSSLWTSLGIWGALQIAYTVLVLWIVQARTGATAGKGLFNIRTVDEAGQPPGLGKQLVRGVVWIVDGIITICGVPVIAALTILFSRGHRRLGDMAASTYVVGVADTGSPIVVPQAGGAVATATAPTVSYGSGPPSGQAAGGPTFAPPAAGPAATPSPGAQPSAGNPPPGQAEGGGPQWDPARNAYIYWDASRSAWLVHDDATGEWKPLS